MKNLSSLSKWLLFGIASYALVAIFTAPASLIFSLLDHEEVSASGISGSAWKGEANHLVVGDIQTSEVRWKLKPMALLTLSAGAEVNAKVPGGSVRGNFKSKLFNNSGQIMKLQGVIKLGDFAKSIQQPLLLDGKLGLQLQKVSWSDNIVDELLGEVLLVDLIEPITKTEVGSFEIQFDENQGDTIKGIISDTSAVFKLNGTIILNSDRTYQFDGLVQPTKDTAGEVLIAIESIGAVRDREGNYTLNFVGNY